LEEKKQSIKELRERALFEHDQRSEEIHHWTEKNGGEHHRVNRYATDVSAKTVSELIDTIRKELEIGQNFDRAILLHVFSYLQTYDFFNTDEAGRDTPGFSLAISELDVALKQLKLDPKNAMRYLVYRYKLKTYANNLIMLNFAPILYLESALSCNLMCVMCYQSDSALQNAIKASSVKLMKWDLFTKVIDEAAAFNCCAVVFAGRGEPTLNPRFSEMLKYCHEKGILDIKFNTNAMTLTEKMAREWLSIKAPLTIVFSVDAADKDTFEKIRIGASFDKVVNNIKMFNRIRNDEFPDSPVRTRVSMTLFKDGQDPEKARKLWASLVDEFSAKVALSEQSGSIYQSEKDGKSKNIYSEVKCKELFTSFHIWSDGTVNPCENDYLSHLQVGNAYKESLFDLWNGSTMMKLRIAHMSGKKNSCYPCNGCSGY